MHCHLCARPQTFEQDVLAHTGQTKPPETFSSSSLPSHDSSSENLFKRPINVSLLSHSRLLRAPACPFTISFFALSDASTLHPHCTVWRRQESLRLCWGSSVIKWYFSPTEVPEESKNSKNILPSTRRKCPLTVSDDPSTRFWYFIEEYYYETLSH